MLMYVGENMHGSMDFFILLSLVSISYFSFGKDWPIPTHEVTNMYYKLLTKLLQPPYL